MANRKKVGATERFSVYVTPERKAEIENLAQELGVTASSMVAYWIGERIKAEKLLVEPTMQSISDGLKEKVFDSMRSQIQTEIGEANS